MTFSLQCDGVSLPDAQNFKLARIAEAKVSADVSQLFAAGAELK